MTLPGARAGRIPVPAMRRIHALSDHAFLPSRFHARLERTRPS